jgi:hypothetical protein
MGHAIKRASLGDPADMPTWQKGNVDARHSRLRINGNTGKPCDVEESHYAQEPAVLLLDLYVVAGKRRI